MPYGVISIFRIGLSMIKKLPGILYLKIFLLPISSLSQEIMVKSSITPPNQNEQIIQRIDPNMDAFVHFDLDLADKVEEQKIREAVHHFPRLENYRFVDSRRRIVLSGGLGFVVLYSAEELQQRSGRRVRPQNIKDVNQAMNIEFVLTDQGEIKEKVVIDK